MDMEWMLPNEWQHELGSELEKPYFLRLRKFLSDEYSNQEIYPSSSDIFNAFQFTPFSKVKVVILGQDPYHGPNQAHGLSFSVKPEVDLPPSLKNIFKELESDLHGFIPNNGYLKKWADQGVLLLNTVLTVRSGQAHSHRGMGWETFTDEAIRRLNNRKESIIFLLWGKPAQSKINLIDSQKHCIISAPHPSPLSAYRGFFGSRPFSKINDILKQQGQKGIDWQIDHI